LLGVPLVGVGLGLAPGLGLGAGFAAVTVGEEAELADCPPHPARRSRKAARLRHSRIFNSFISRELFLKWRDCDFIF
jgi:hypothetical protein